MFLLPSLHSVSQKQTPLDRLTKTSSCFGNLPSTTVFFARQLMQSSIQAMPFWFVTATVPSIRFQVLFHSLSKVLFNFPSRYLFAIGLLSLFSLRSSLPPIRNAISSIPTHISKAVRGIRRDYHPVCNILQCFLESRLLLKTTIHEWLDFGLLAVHSPLLCQS